MRIGVLIGIVLMMGVEMMRNGYIRSFQHDQHPEPRSSVAVIALVILTLALLHYAVPDWD